MSHGPCEVVVVVVVAAAAHQTQRWVQDRIPPVEVVEVEAEVVGAAVGAEVVEVGVEARLRPQQPRMQAALEAFDHV